MKKIPYTKFDMEPLKVRAKSSILSNLAPQNQPELKLKKGTRSFEETLRLVEEVEEQTKGEYFVKHNCNCPKEKDCTAILELHTLSKPVEELPGEVQYIKHCRTCICK